jgi:hypothetical protein
VPKVNEEVTKSDACLNVARYVKRDDNTATNLLEAGFKNFLVMSFKIYKICSYSFFLSCFGLYICVPLFNFVSYIFLLLRLSILIVCMLCSLYSVFIMPTGILRLP